MLGGEWAFQLHDTYGFPIDLTLEMAAEQGLTVDEDGFRRLMQEQRDRAKADAKAKKAGAPDQRVYSSCGPTGRRRSPATPSWPPSRRSGASARRRAGQGARRRASRRGRSRPDPVLRGVRRSGLRRRARSPVTACALEVLDVQRPVKGLIVHKVRVAAGELSPGPACWPRSTASGGSGACQAHSGTHVMHAALRQVLGPTALQSGSYNKPGYLRLDFAWPSGLSQTDPVRRGGGGEPGDPPRPQRHARPTCRCPRPGRSARWRCSARPTTKRSAWSRWADPGPASSAAAPTSSTPRRSAWSP